MIFLLVIWWQGFGEYWLVTLEMAVLDGPRTALDFNCLELSKLQQIQYLVEVLCVQLPDSPPTPWIFISWPFPGLQFNGSSIWGCLQVLLSCQVSTLQTIALVLCLSCLKFPLFLIQVSEWHGWHGLCTFCHMYEYAICLHFCRMYGPMFLSCLLQYYLTELYCDFCTHLQSSHLVSFRDLIACKRCKFHESGVGVSPWK